MDLSGLMWGVRCPPCHSISHQLTTHRVADIPAVEWWANLFSEEEGEDDVDVEEEAEEGEEGEEEPEYQLSHSSTACN